jgi:GH24 family phage-related lysozyme (muramidase)
MKTSDVGIQLIKRFEGLRLMAYKPVSTEKFYTIGYGHYGADVSRETIITKERAEELLKKDLEKFEKAVTALNRTWTQNQFDALTSFAFNCGAANLKRLVANRDTLQIADALLLYNKAGGKVLSGLVRRRKAERALFLKNNELEQIAHEVIDGKWGNGRTRKDKLTEAGYNYHEVQLIVNRLITGG